MATAGDIAESVLDTVQDGSFDSDLVISLLNKCALDLSWELILPALDAEGQVVTVATGPVSPLPADFQRNLYHCQDETSFNRIKVCNSKDQLSRHYSYRLDSSGTRVKGVAVSGPNLYYAPIPTPPATLSIRYQRTPGTITEATDLGTILPDGFDYLWENYALWKLYQKIEQGLEGQKIDTAYYMNLYLGMRDELGLSLKEGVSMPAPPIARMERW